MNIAASQGTIDAAAVHDSAIVIDLICPWIDYPRLPRDKRLSTLTRMRDSGYTYVSLTVALDDPDIHRVAASLAHHRRYVVSQPDKYVLIETVDDIVRAKQDGKLGVGFHFQGTEPLARDIRMVEVYYRLGIRHMLMAYNQKNSVGDGCHEENDGGLSRYGRRLIAEMNQVGMLVDVSHTGYRTAMETIEVSADPVVFSHSNPKALFDHPRNITDEQIRACVRRGGVIGLNGCGAFLGDNDISTERLVRHIDYVAQLAGPAHVGLGMDFVYDQESWHPYILTTSVGQYIEVGSYLPEETIRYAAPEQLPEVTEQLLRLGYSDADVRGVLGGNWLGILRRVWKAPSR